VAYKRFQKSISSDTTGNQFQVILREINFKWYYAPSVLQSYWSRIC